MNETKGYVIVSQSKAWMNSAKFSMYMDLILCKSTEKEEKLFLWLDNCSSHRAYNLTEKLKQISSLQFAFLPENTIDNLQPLDLEINGPLKNKTKKKMKHKLLDEFEKYLHSYQEGNAQPITLPTPSPKEAIQDIMEIVDNDFAHPQLQASINKSIYFDGWE